VTQTNPPLVAVDIGNSRIKLGRFNQLDGQGLPLLSRIPEPSRTAELASERWTEQQLLEVLGDSPASKPDAAKPEAATWVLASVNPPAAARLADWLAARGATTHQLTAADIPITVDLREPNRVGVDRLVGAAAANMLRDPGRSAIVVDLGSAITVDLVSAAGTFAGGAILPGIAMSARVLHEQTEQLPHHPREELTAEPPALGRSTDAAIDSGLFWGAVGAIRELIARLADEQPNGPHVFLTGGAAPSVANLLGESTVHVPHLLLAGVAIAYKHSMGKT